MHTSNGRLTFQPLLLGQAELLARPIGQHRTRLSSHPSIAVYLRKGQGLLGTAVILELSVPAKEACAITFLFNVVHHLRFDGSRLRSAARCYLYTHPLSLNVELSFMFLYVCTYLAGRVLFPSLLNLSKFATDVSVSDIRLVGLDCIDVSQS